jgi:hypothetical protein
MRPRRGGRSARRIVGWWRSHRQVLRTGNGCAGSRARVDRLRRLIRATSRHRAEHRRSARVIPPDEHGRGVSIGGLEAPLDLSQAVRTVKQQDDASLARRSPGSARQRQRLERARRRRDPYPLATQRRQQRRIGKRFARVPEHADHLGVTGIRPRAAVGRNRRRHHATRRGAVGRARTSRLGPRGVIGGAHDSVYRIAPAPDSNTHLDQDVGPSADRASSNDLPGAVRVWNTPDLLPKYTVTAMGSDLVRIVPTHVHPRTGIPPRRRRRRVAGSYARSCVSWNNRRIILRLLPHLQAPPRHTHPRRPPIRPRHRRHSPERRDRPDPPPHRPTGEPAMSGRFSPCATR